jgi:hypothetical protein
MMVSCAETARETMVARYQKIVSVFSKCLLPAFDYCCQVHRLRCCRKALINLIAQHPKRMMRMRDSKHKTKKRNSSEQVNRPQPFAMPRL